MTLWECSDKLKLGKSSRFVKKNLRPLRLTDGEFEADFFFDHGLSEKDGEVWIGMVVEREFGAVLALEDVRFRPPTVNDLAAILANAMLRPLTEGGGTADPASSIFGIVRNGRNCGRSWWTSAWTLPLNWPRRWGLILPQPFSNTMQLYPSGVVASYYEANLEGPPNWREME